ncbi:MAG TPA: hypothetical protein VGS99_05315, partial [Gammaproteobacteria bacterium]|nr:hypothetical protein [Gammaproteobacteria bacterium]
MYRRWHTALSGIALAFLVAAPVGADPAGTYFQLKLQTGQRYADIFSKAISVKGQGFDEIVRRVSGTAVYQVTNPDPSKPGFTISYRYDGRPDGSGA